MGLSPAVAAVRVAVRRAVRDLEPGAVIVSACSGGADSIALLAAAVFESRSAGLRVVGVTVDHGLQDGSAERAAAVVEQMQSIGAAVAVSREVLVGSTGGPEAAARAARYAALSDLADEYGAAAILLGHTRDDQAETVLLGLARGSGARALAAMPPVAGRLRRPLLDITRAETTEACRAQGIDVWDDPHNADATFTRARVRARVLPVLEAELGPGVRDNLARTARLLRDDADALDALAADAYSSARTEHGVRIDVLTGCSSAVRRRVLRLAALEAGCPGTELFAVHVDALDRLVGDWHGQGPLHLPGHVRATRAGAVLHLAPGAVAG